MGYHRVAGVPANCDYFGSELARIYAIAKAHSVVRLAFLHYFVVFRQ